MPRECCTCCTQRPRRVPLLKELSDVFRQARNRQSGLIVPSSQTLARRAPILPATPRFEPRPSTPALGSSARSYPRHAAPMAPHPDWSKESGSHRDTLHRSLRPSLRLHARPSKTGRAPAVPVARRSQDAAPRSQSLCAPSPIYPAPVPLFPARTRRIPDPRPDAPPPVHELLPPIASPATSFHPTG